VDARRPPTHLAKAKGLMAGGCALLAFVAALAVGTAGAPAFGGLSWVMVTAGALGVVYVTGAAILGAFELREEPPRLRPAVVNARGGSHRSSGR
jgi:hypothetical protein